jgi:hypothetical protein
VTSVRPRLLVVFIDDFGWILETVDAIAFAIALEIVVEAPLSGVLECAP